MQITNFVSNTFIIPQTKGGVGKTTIAMILAALLHEKDKTINVYEIDDNNQNKIKSEFINFKSIRINESEGLIDAVYFDSLSKDKNVLNIIDCGGGNDTKLILYKLAQNDMIRNNYYVPIFDDVDHVNNALDTISLIRSYDKNANINLIFNRCHNLNQLDIKDQFISVFGSEEYDISPRIKELNYNNSFFIPNSNIFSILKVKNISLLDTYLQSIEIVKNKHEYQAKWTKQGKEIFSNKMKMFRLGKRVIELVKMLEPLKKSLKGE